jgi:hypothetical protein
LRSSAPKRSAAAGQPGDDRFAVLGDHKRVSLR